jgi:hypothetical protein
MHGWEGRAGHYIYNLFVKVPHAQNSIQHF